MSPAPARPGLPRVAIVGRPNVGKSTLVNRFVGRRAAIVEEKPGVTRDRAEHEVDWTGRRFVVIDTGGWEARPESSIAQAVRDQAELAVGTADVVVFVCDAAVGVTPEDAEAARLLRRAGIPVVLAANKVDGERAEADTADLYALGLGDPVAVSALHGRRTGDLLDAVVGLFPEPTEAEASEEDVGEVRVAILGRPNVGKSTLFNRLIGEERSIVHDAPGTTRDAVDTVVELGGCTYRFVDTAGLRRRSRVDDRTEYYGRVRALQALQRADVALLVVDATAGLTSADQKVAEEILDAGRSCVVLLNKWDLLDTETKMALPAEAADKLRFLSWAPLLRISARTGSNVGRILPAIDAALASYRARVPTHALVKTVESATARHPPRALGGGPARIRYATQVRTSPPSFVVFANRRLVPEYTRYLEHQLRDRFGFEGTPLRVRVRVQTRDGR